MPDTGPSVMKIALLTSDPALFQHVSGALRGYAVIGELADAKVILVDLKPQQTTLPSPLPAGVPVVALAPTRTFDVARALFLNGAADVLVRTAPVGTLRDAVERLLFGAIAGPATGPGLANELFFLRDVSQAAAEGATLPWLFERIVEVVAEAMGVDIVSLMLLEFDPEVRKALLRIKAARGLPDDVVEVTRVELGHGISGRVAANGQPLLITDVEQAGLALAASHPRYLNKALLSVPIKARSQTIGVLNVNNKVRGDVFDERDMALLMTLCNQAGLAIDNTRLFEDLRQNAGRLGALNQKLRQIGKAKSELIVNLSHEIKTPLTAIQGYVDLLRAGLVEPRRTAEILGKVHERSQHLARLAERLIIFFTLDSGLAGFFPQSFLAEEWVRVCVDELRPRAEAKSVRFEVDVESLRLPVLADRQYYRELLLALLDNAIKFNRKDGAVRVYGKRIEHEGQAHLEVFVQDTGPGIAENLQAAIFEDFKQTDDIMTAKPDGLGLGLAIARAIVDGHGCRLRLVRSDADGSVFAFTMPIDTAPAEA
jgi:signal transduction histidine kinase